MSMKEMQLFSFQILHFWLRKTQKQGWCVHEKGVWCKDYIHKESVTQKKERKNWAVCVWFFILFLFYLFLGGREIKGAIQYMPDVHLSLTWSVREVPTWMVPWLSWTECWTPSLHRLPPQLSSASRRFCSILRAVINIIIIRMLSLLILNTAFKSFINLSSIFFHSGNSYCKATIVITIITNKMLKIYITSLLLLSSPTSWRYGCIINDDIFCTV